jgi:hypothetical protein
MAMLCVVEVPDTEVWQAIGSYVPNFHTASDQGLEGAQ